MLSKAEEGNVCQSEMNRAVNTSNIRWLSIRYTSVSDRMAFI